MKLFCSLLLILTGLQSAGQFREIEYKSWEGDVSKLINYQKTNSILILTIVLPGKEDTVNLIFKPVTPEVDKLYHHLASFPDAEQMHVLKDEEQGQKLLYTKIRAPLRSDSSLIATYYDYFFEEKLFVNH